MSNIPYTRLRVREYPRTIKQMLEEWSLRELSTNVDTGVRGDNSRKSFVNRGRGERISSLQQRPEKRPNKISVAISMSPPYGPEWYRFILSSSLLVSSFQSRLRPLTSINRCQFAYPNAGWSCRVRGGSWHRQRHPRTRGSSKALRF